MTAYTVHIDLYRDTEHKQLVSHEERYYESQDCAEFAVWDILFNYIPEQYMPYVNVYITTKEYLTVEEEANADDYDH